MPPWILKAGVQGAISLVPGRDRLNYALQSRVTQSVALNDAGFEEKLERVPRHLANYAAATGRTEPPQSAFELGTGWYPVVPVALAIAGIERVVSLDIKPLADGARVRRVLECFAEYRDAGKLRELLPSASQERLDRLDQCLGTELRDPKALLAPLGVKLEIKDARATGRPGESFDLLVSNNTLEHIPADALGQITREFARLAKPGAVTDHFIDMRDHYADFDRSINRLNFLRYSDAAWWPFNNRLQYQNRLRLPEYREALEAAGFTVVDEQRIVGAEGEFDDLKLARRFRRFAREDALVLYVWLTGRRDSDVADDPNPG